MENPFEAKPRLARKPTMHRDNEVPAAKGKSEVCSAVSSAGVSTAPSTSKFSNVTPSSSSSTSGGSTTPSNTQSSTSTMQSSPSTVSPFDYSPHRGVTFKENRNLDLQMVGTGYGEDAAAHQVETTKSTSYVTKHRRRVSKGTTNTFNSPALVWFFLIPYFNLCFSMRSAKVLTIMSNISASMYTL